MQVEQAVPRAADKQLFNEEGSYKFIVRLDKPSNGSSRFLDEIDFAGWFFIPSEASIDDFSPSFELVVEELLVDETSLRAGMGLQGKVVGEFEQAGEPYIKEFNFFKSKEEQVDEFGGERGQTFRFEGLLNVSALFPSTESPARLFAFRVAAGAGALRSVSNEVRVNFPRQSDMNSAYGGFLSPSSYELHSDFMCIRGWVLCSGDAAESVEISLNETPVGFAEFGIESKEQSNLLPDLKESAFCGFELVIPRSELSSELIDCADRSSGLKLSADCKFASGKLHTIAGPQVLWYADPRSASLQRNSFTEGHSEIESVSINEHGFIRVEGWFLRESGRACSWYIKRLNDKLEILSAEGQVSSGFCLSFFERFELSERYPTAASSKSAGFVLEFNPLLLGRVPGFIQLLIRYDDEQRYYRIGSASMCARIAECVRSCVLGPRGLKPAVSRMIYTADSLKSRTESIWRMQSSSRAISAGAGRVPKRLLFVSHNMSPVEGSPKVLLDVVKAAAARGVSSENIMVLSARPGGLERSFLDVGLSPKIIPEADIFCQSWGRYHFAQEQFFRICREFEPDCIYANVIDSFWSIDAAERLGIQSLWCIHESIDPLKHYSLLDQRLKQRFLHALSYAGKLIFVSKTTERLFSHLAPSGGLITIANGVCLESIKRSKEQWTKHSARRVLGISESAHVVSIVGTTTERKGQDIFLREMNLLKKKMPDREFCFLLVGAREIEFLDTLRAMVEELGIGSSVRFIPEDPEVAKYYIASDVMVICSREESAPLVSLEAFAYERPLVSTTVFGLAEQVEDGVNALAYELSREGELAGQVQRLLEDEKLAAELTSCALKRLESDFSLKGAMQKHLEVILSSQTP